MRAVIPEMRGLDGLYDGGGDCDAGTGYLNKFTVQFESVTVKRPLVILALIAAAALVLGFLVFGGANMGN